MNITEEEFKALPKSVQKLFKKNEDGSYSPDAGGDDDTALKRALDRERDSNKQLKADIAEIKKEHKRLQDEAAARNDDANKKKGDVEALEKSWQAKLDKQAADAKAKEDRLLGQLRKATVEAEANKMASELSEHPHLLLPHIINNLDMEIDDSTGEVKIRVLEDGKPSSNSLEDFRKKIVADDKLAPLVKASEASGGGAGGSKGKTGSAEKPLSEMTATEEAAFANEHPERYKQMVEEAGTA